MSQLRKITKDLCSKCKYSGKITGLGYSVEEQYCCEYILHKMADNAKACSRLFENGKEAYDLDMCNKFEKDDGKKRSRWGVTNAMFNGKAKKCKIV